MTERDLNSLKDLPVPLPRAGSRRAAMRAALQAYDNSDVTSDAEELRDEPEKNGPSATVTKGNPYPRRRTHKQSKRNGRRTMRFSKSTYAAAASLAAIAIAIPAAIVYLQDRPQPQPQTGILGTFSSSGGSTATNSPADSDASLALPNAAPPPAPDVALLAPPPPSVSENRLAAASAPATEARRRPKVSERKKATRVQTAAAATAGRQVERDRISPASRLGAQPPTPATGILNLSSGRHSGRLAAAQGHPTAAGLGVTRRDEVIIRPEASRDRFEGAASNPVKQVASEPVSTFSIDVDTSAYSFVRSSLQSGALPPRDAVRVEELINYFTYDYPRPESAEAPFKPTITVAPSPWNTERQLVHVALKGYELADNERPRANLVFLVDVSGSMASSDKLPLLKQGLTMLLNKLQPEDSVGIVTYASGSGIALEPTKVKEKAKIASAIARLGAGGSTAGAAGIQDAYRLARQAFDKDAVNRVILGTDGDFNVGTTDHQALKRLIEEKRKTGIYLSILGFGRGNYNDALMQALAQNGNGTAAYIDTLSEARKVLIEEASSTLFPIAKDVKIQIEFNPAVIADYRLVGYETRALRREDFNNDKVDAGEVGSGHAVTAIYEVTPVGAEVKTVDDLRYKQASPAKPVAASADAPNAGELAFFKLRYKLPDEDKSRLITMPVQSSSALDDLASAPGDVRFAIAVAGFAQKLRGDAWAGDVSYDDIIALANASKGADDYGLRAQFVELVRLAKALTPQP